MQKGLKSTHFKFGFTLAEVLITLGIIGVVAAITIPSLMNKTNDKETVSALKETYSQLSQAYMLAIQDNGTPDNWGLNDYSSGDPAVGAQNIMNNIIPYFKSIKKCADSSDCFSDDYKSLNSDLMSNVTSSPAANPSPAIILSNGVALHAWSGWAKCDGNLGVHNICGSIEVDINGIKKPNVDGRDYFVFWITKYNGIVPNGVATIDSSDSNSFDRSCKDKATASGHGCAAWVIYNENMDYLHCNNLSWNGPTKCQ